MFPMLSLKVLFFKEMEMKLNLFEMNACIQTEIFKNVQLSLKPKRLYDKFKSPPRSFE